MPNVREVHKLSTFKRFIEIGGQLATPEDLQILQHAVNRLAPGSNLEPIAMFALMVAGAVANKVVAAIDGVIERIPLPADHPEGAPAPRPAWADDVMKALGLTGEPPPAEGPIDSIEEMHARASRAGIVLA